MCITCTDVAVFAGHNYPEKWYVTARALTNSGHVRLRFARGQFHPLRGRVRQCRILS